MAKKHFTDEIVLDLIIEARIMGQIDHPYIIKAFNQYESPEHYEVIFEVCEGSELNDLVEK